LPQARANARLIMMAPKPSVTEEGFEGFTALWESHRDQLQWRIPFLLPPWLRVWQEAFAPGATPSFLAVRDGEAVIGIAPLLITGDTASVVGSPDVCDYADLIVAPGKETVFCEGLCNALKQRHVRFLDIASTRPDSVVVSCLLDLARQRGYEVACQEEDVSLERDLPPTWDDFLGLLSSKQRHEVKRKLRRLEEAGTIDYRFVEDRGSVPAFMDMFLSLFVESRQDKAAFMTGEMEGFFRSLAEAMSRAGLLRSGVLEVDGVPTAAVMAFDLNDTVYLYNSAYDPEYSSLSVGVLSKALCIKDSIERGKKRFDFLKGGERYKYHLGGQEVQLYRCRFSL